MSDSNQNDYLKFKKEHLDPKSKSFCAAKWLGANIWLAHGKTSSCHLPPSHSIDLQSLEADPSALHNTPQKIFMRQQMQKGERPSECQFCWSMEDLSPEIVSERIFTSFQYPKEDLEKIFGIF